MIYCVTDSLEFEISFANTSLSLNRCHFGVSITLTMLS